MGPARRRRRAASGPVPMTVRGQPSRVKASTATSRRLYGVSADTQRKSGPISAGDAAGHRVNFAEIVTDPDRGGNALFFPVEAAERDGYEALEEDGTIVCLAFVAYDF